MDDGKDYLEDAELGDEDDPEYREEMFRTFRHMKVKPEEIRTDQKFAEEYAEWLKTAPPEDEEE